MTSSYDILALTDHSVHSRHNSVYGLMRAIAAHDRAGQVKVASRGDTRNHPFFNTLESDRLFCVSVDSGFEFSEDHSPFERGDGQWESIQAFDLIIMRLPRPIVEGFFTHLTDLFPDECIINRPSGITETSSKTFLLNFPNLCPPMKLCKTADDVYAFSRRYPIVLKPLESYGGQGLIKIEGSTYTMGSRMKPLDELLDRLRTNPVPYLAMKFMQNVDQGDTRIIVSNGRIIGASLRLPPDGSWLCNVAKGGSIRPAEADAQERRIAEIISPVLLEKGIVLYGFDTLVNNEGKRVLSEINTLSIGGITPAQRESGQPLESMAAQGIWDYISERI